MAMNPRATETQRARLDRRKISLRGMRSPWEDRQQLADNIAPTRYRANLNQNEGKKLRSKIVDSTGSFALRTLASGMHSGITSPARPWFRLTTFDPELKDYGPVRMYLDGVQARMREIFAASNIYNAFHTGYGDLGLFGQSCGLLVTDNKSIVRMIQLQHGAFWLARDHAGVATTLLREFSWSCERIIERFGYKNVSVTIQNCYDRGDYDERFTVNHIVEPRRERDPARIDKANKPFASIYWEEGNRSPDKDGLLEVSGFDENPIIAPPWELVAEDSYANSPGMEALPDVRMLQVEQTDKAQAIQKMHKPPMKGPLSMKNNPASLLPGSITYVDDATGAGYTPAMNVNLSIADLGRDIQSVQQRIERAFYADLFLMLANMEGVQPRNNMEIMERKEEKMLALGPVLENVQGAQLQPVIARTYAEMDRRGELPELPAELDDGQLKIEYISILAQAQKAVATGAIERTFSFVGNLAAVNPAVLDKLDMDEGIDQYADMVGAPAGVVVSDDKVSEIRKQRADAQAKQQQTEQMAQAMPAIQQGAQAAELLSRTDASNPNSMLAKLGIG